MLVEIEDKIISTEIFSQKFVCDLNACKGACCVEGDTGAPLTNDEVELIQNNLDKIKPFMTESGISQVEKNGVSYLDEEQEPVTTLLNGRDCAFVFKDEHGIAKCSIEKAFRENKIDFNHNFFSLTGAHELKTSEILSKLKSIKFEQNGIYPFVNFQNMNSF
jgi:hypothetical protein